MSKQRDTKLTLADLIAKKADKQAVKFKSEDVYIDGLGGTVTITVPSKSVIYKAIDMMDRTSLESVMYANCFLIYNSIKELQSAELLEAYDISDNVLIVDELLTIAEVNELTNKIMVLAGVNKPEEVESELKN
ncbi:hypothetical protein SAMN05444162_3455 [Paenibacillaceae bacterium GAS479]|nr:hypothetical protein SAMN05444162_3455 [Paenibacillaceae bacterium GAS479]